MEHDHVTIVAMTGVLWTFWGHSSADYYDSGSTSSFQSCSDLHRPQFSQKELKLEGI